jgi:hypothetical protein
LPPLPFLWMLRSLIHCASLEWHVKTTDRKGWDSSFPSMLEQWELYVHPVEISFRRSNCRVYKQERSVTISGREILSICLPA